MVTIRLQKAGTVWRVGINIGKKMLWLGHFKNEKDAARTYNEAAKKYFGEFASLNEL